MSAFVLLYFCTFAINSTNNPKGNALAMELAVYHHLNLYRFNSVVCAFSAWPDYP